jgi:hypothetical protein
VVRSIGAKSLDERLMIRAKKTRKMFGEGRIFGDSNNEVKKSIRQFQVNPKSFL